MSDLLHRGQTVLRRAGAWLLGQGMLLCAFAILLGPYLALAIAVGSWHYGGAQGYGQALPTTGRQVTLLGESLLFSGIVACGACVLGVLCALQLRDTPRVRPFFFVMLPVLIIVPVYVHGLAWATCLATCSAYLTSVNIILPSCRGWAGSGWTEIMALLPLATGIALVGVQTVDRAQLEAAALHRSQMQVLLRIDLPLAAPFLLAGLGLLLLISLLDYSIPSLYAVNVYAMEIFTQYSLDGNPASAAVTALPLLLVAMAVILFGVARVRQAASLPLRHTIAPLGNEHWPLAFRLLKAAALILLLAQAVLPMASMLTLVRSVSAWGQAVQLARTEIGSTLEIMMLVLLVGLPLSLLTARPLLRSDWLGKICWIALCVPLAMPAPLTGIGAIHLSSLLGIDDPGLMLPVLVNLVRFVPVAAFVCYATQYRVEAGVMEARRLYQRSPWHGFLRVTLPLYRSGLLLAGILLVTLTAGELGATLLVAQPGAPTLMIRLFNLLHYGASREVAALCLTLMAGIGLLGALTQVLIAVRQRPVF